MYRDNLKGIPNVSATAPTAARMDIYALETTMSTMSMIAMVMTLTASSAMASSAIAQGTQSDTGHDMMQMMGGGMMAMDDAPAMILKMKASLELTGDQVQRLTTIQKTAQAAKQQHMMMGMQAMQTAKKLLDVPAPDLKAYEAGMRDAANHMILAHTGMARADMDANQVLTAQQRDRMTFGRKMMKEMKENAEKEHMMMEKMKENMKKDRP